MTTISAQTILRSRNAAAPAKVLSTLLLRYPRWIHAEQRTHRVIPLDEGLTFDEPTPSLMADPNLSRNASSSRAIPLDKQIAAMLEDPAVPLWWGKNEPGMQAYAELEGEALEEAKLTWQIAMHKAINSARCMAEIGAHKQIVNRIIEPFTHITVLVSATEWDNYLELRDHEAAEPHIAMLAREIRKCLEDESTVQTLPPGGWHLPFITDEDKRSVVEWDDGEELRRACSKGWIAENQWAWYGLGKMQKLSVGRCASTSYKTVDGFDMTFDRASKLHDQFVHSHPQHASPLEHVAQADTPAPDGTWRELPSWNYGHEHGNFIGFRQYRHIIGGGQ